MLLALTASRFRVGGGSGHRLARSAAPEAISRDAKVMILGQHGYETAVKGKNDFVCLVERSWSGILESKGESANLLQRAGCSIQRATPDEEN